MAEHRHPARTCSGCGNPIQGLGWLCTACINNWEAALDMQLTPQQRADRAERQDRERYRRLRPFLL